MNFWNWNTLENTYDYTWKSKYPKWRHDLTPSHPHRTRNTAIYVGRWDGGIDLLHHKTNISYTKDFSYSYDLIYSALIRPMPLEYTQDDYSFFQVLITYKSKVLALINDVRFIPIYNEFINKKKIKSNKRITIKYF